MKIRMSIGDYNGEHWGEIPESLYNEMVKFETGETK